MDLYFKYLFLVFQFRQTIPTVGYCFDNTVHPETCHTDVQQKSGKNTFLQMK